MDLVGRGRWPDMSEDDKKTYGIQWSREVGSGSISSVSWESVPSNLTFEDSTINGTQTLVNISGGTGKTDYVVICQITMAGSSALTATAKPRLKVLADEEVY